MSPEEMIRSLPDQMVWEDVAEDVGGFSKVVLCGMGGSGIVGDIVASWAERNGFGIPVISYRGYHLPRWVEGRDSLVVCVSYSGNTEETVSNLLTALERGCRVVCVSSGGRLEEIAREKGLKHLRIPGGYAPRYALGFMLSKVLSVLGAEREEIEEVSESLRERMRETEERGREIAERLYGYLPVVYATPLTEACAFRWKTQINENSKTLAYFAVLPELHHNEVVGLENAEIRGKCGFVLLYDEEDDERVKLRVGITVDVLKDLGLVPLVLKGEGGSYLSRVLHLIYTGDWTSYFLALKYHYDPLPVKVIDMIKNRLK